MNMKITTIMLMCAITILTFGLTYAYGASLTTIDNSGRREYTYCPLSDSDVRGLNAEIDGCPLVRIYVNNWNSLTPLQQSTIDTTLRAKGFVDSSEHIIK